MNTRSHSLKHVLQATLLAAVSCVASVAAADDVPQKTVAVRYADLNLSSEAGVQQLYDRIRAAARSVCGSPQELVPLEIRQQRKQCAKAAVASAVKQVDNGILTAMHSGKASRRLG